MMNLPNKRPLGRPVQQQDSQPTAQHILQTASRLFMEKGFNPVSMNQVAEQCGVTKATVYYYYSSKTELFVAAMVETLTQVNRRIREMLDEAGPFRDRLIRITENYLKVPQMHVNGMFEQVKDHLSKEQLEMLIRREDVLYETLREGFDAAAANGEIACEDTNIATHLYVSMLRVGERQYDRTNFLFADNREAAEAIVALLWRGIHV